MYILILGFLGQFLNINAAWREDRKDLHSSAITYSIVCFQDFRKGMNLYLTKFQQKNAATGNCGYYTLKKSDFWRQNF